MLWIRKGNELLTVNAVRLIAYPKRYDMVAFVTTAEGGIGRFVIDRDENILELRRRLFNLQDRLVKKGVIILPAGYD